MSKNAEMEAAGQQRLPFDKPLPEIVALRSIDARAAGLGEHRWAQIREVVIAIAYCSLRDGECQARNEKLRSIANENRAYGTPAIASERTFRRCLQEAVKLGLIISTPRYQKSALRSVEWAAVRRLVEFSRRQSQAAKKSGHSMASVWPASGQRVATLQPSQPTKPKGSTAPKLADESTKEKKTIKKSNPQKKIHSPAQLGATQFNVAQINAARLVCRHLVRKLGLRHRLPRRDRDFVAKLGVLSLKWGEHWLQDAVEGCVQVQPKPKKPLAYLHSVLDEKCRAAGSSLNRELARCHVPRELLQRGESADLQPRLCGSEVL